MQTIDTSSLIAFFSGAEDGADVRIIRSALADGTVFMLPPVIAEILSDPKLPLAIEKVILEIPPVEELPAFWQRVGYLRRRVLAKNLKVRLADALIAQFCLDHDLELITRDSDFKTFKKIAGLKVVGI